MFRGKAFGIYRDDTKRMARFIGYAGGGMGGKPYLCVG